MCNVFTFHKSYSPSRVAEIEPDCRAGKLGCVDCKKLLAVNLNDAMRPFRDKRAALAADPNLVRDVLSDGARRARAIATVTMAEVRERVGLP